MIRPAANSTFIKPIRRITKTIPPIIIRASGRYNTSLIRIWIRSLARETFPVFNANNEINVAAVKTRYAITIRERRTTLIPVIIHKNHGDLYPFFVPESHILQVRPKLPQAIGNVESIAYGMPSLSVYLPYYQGCVIINPR